MNELPSPSLPLVVEDHPDASVMPTTPFPQPRRPFAMKMGVFDRRGRVVRESLLWRSYGRMGFPAEDTTPARSDDREVVFAGHLPGHFGHFILEGLSRLWFARRRPDMAVAWACPAGEPTPGYTTWQQQILEVVGITNEARFVTQPTRFARVHVPQAGYRVKDFCADQQAAFLAAYPARARHPDLRLWLSRSGLASAYESLHAARLEQELADNGWTVVQPERLPIREQLELLAGAVHVAGEEGSAFHLLALLGDVTGLRVDIFCRRPDRPVERQNHNYQTIADVRALDQELHVMPEERVLGVERGHIRKVATTLAGHLETLGVVRPWQTAAHPSRSTASSKVPHPAHATEAILSMSSSTSTSAEQSTGDAGSTKPSMAGLVDTLAAALRAGAYLEVGVTPDVIRPAVGIPIRDVVRPRFATDPRRSAGDGEQLFEMPPDEFFACCADLARRYDVIVLDGVGGNDELVELLIASRRHAGGRTVWLVRGLDEEDTRSAADVVGHRFPWLVARAVATDGGTCLVLVAQAAAMGAEAAAKGALDSLVASGIPSAPLAAVR